MAFDASMGCPSCGVAIESITAHTRSLECPHCSNWIYLSDQGWAASAGFEQALDAPSMFRIGRSGELSGRRFVVAGRIRLGYGSGAWDEWWLEFDDGNHQWLEEDDGSFQLHEHVHQRSSGRELRNCHVGTMVEIEQKNYLVTEKYAADVAGAQGAVPYAIVPGEQVTCIDIMGGGAEYSIEISGDEVNMTRAVPVSASGFDWD